MFNIKKKRERRVCFHPEKDGGPGRGSPPAVATCTDWHRHDTISFLQDASSTRSLTNRQWDAMRMRVVRTGQDGEWWKRSLGAEGILFGIVIRLKYFFPPLDLFILPQKLEAVNAR